GCRRRDFSRHSDPGNTATSCKTPPSTVGEFTTPSHLLGGCVSTTHAIVAAAGTTVNVRIPLSSVQVRAVVAAGGATLATTTKSFSVFFWSSSTKPSPTNLFRSTVFPGAAVTAVTPLMKRTCCVLWRNPYAVSAFPTGAEYDKAVAVPLASLDLPLNAS